MVHISNPFQYYSLLYSEVFKVASAAGFRQNFGVHRLVITLYAEQEGPYMCGCNTACCLNCVPDHDSCHPYFITWETYILWEFMIHIFPAMELTLFHRRFSKCNQALHLLKIFHNTHFSLCFFSTRLLFFRYSKEYWLLK